MPGHLFVTGRFLSQPDTTNGAFTVVVRNWYNDPVPNSLVVLDFSTALEVRLASSSLVAGTTVNCSHRTVRRVTDSQGIATFTILGAGLGPSTFPSVPTASVSADGVAFGTVRVSVLDLDGANGVGANDLAIWLDDFGAANPSLRGDHDGSGDLGANDLSIWLTAAGTGTSAHSATPACP